MAKGLQDFVIPLSGKINPATAIAQAGISKSKQVSQELFNYDFVGLVVKLFIYFTIAWIIAKYFEGVIGITTTLKSFLSVIGINLPSTVPKPIETLFKEGYHGFHYWDFVKALAILLVAYEGYNYYESNKKLGAEPSAMTMGVFVLIESLLVLITVPDLWQRLSFLRNMTSGGGEPPATNIPPNVGPAWLPTGFSYTQGSDGRYYALVGNNWQLAIMDTPTSGHLSGINLVRVP